MARRPSAFGWSIGEPTGSFPARGPPTWLGAVVAGEAGRGGLLLGDARLTADFAGMDVDVAFRKLRDAATGARRPGIRFTDVPTGGGGFAAARGADTIAGAFHGPSHLEAGGAFQHGRTIGAFGGTRQ